MTKKLNDAQRDELISQYSELVVDNMDMDSLVQYAQEQLANYFDKLSEGMTDWKNPICARIPTEDFDVYDRACAYFTGTELQTMNTYPNGTSKVFAKGYYMMDN